jgi:hypothetical protein
MRSERAGTVSSLKRQQEGIPRNPQESEALSFPSWTSPVRVRSPALVCRQEIGSKAAASIVDAAAFCLVPNPSKRIWPGDVSSRARLGDESVRSRRRAWSHP